jgi:hypothetical protein
MHCVGMKTLSSMQWRTYPAIRRKFLRCRRIFWSCRSARTLDNSAIFAVACHLRPFSQFRCGLGLNLSVMQKKIECQDYELERVMLPLLRGRVFHLTSEETFDDILRCGWIYSRQQTRLAFAPCQPENNYGCRRGWVSLYDLGNPTDSNVAEALISYWLLRAMRRESKHVYLMITESARSSLISWRRASREVGGKELFVPFVEAWYPGDIPLQLISDSLVVTVHRPMR